MWRTRAIGAAVLVTALTAGWARADAPARVEYVVRWGGFDVATATTDLRLDATSYRIGWQGRTTGVLGSLFPFTTTGVAEGRRTADRLIPERFAGESRHRDELRPWSVRFAPDGAAAEVQLPEAEQRERDPVPTALQRGPDPLSLALDALLGMAPGLRAAGTSFDGRRALRASLDCAEPTRSASGSADPPVDVLRCTLAGEVVAGRHRRSGEDRAERPREPVRVRLERGIVADLWWPVRIELPTRWGRVLVDLVRRSA